MDRCLFTRALLASLLALCLAGPSMAQKRLLSEEFPPINFSEGSEARGLAVDVVQEIQRRLQLDLPIEFLPWARAYREVQLGRETALFSMARTAGRERLFKWVGPVVTFYSSIYAPARGGVRLRSIEDAKRAKAVLVVRDWYTSEELKQPGLPESGQRRRPTCGHSHARGRPGRLLRHRAFVHAQDHGAGGRGRRGASKSSTAMPAPRATSPFRWTLLMRGSRPGRPSSMP